MVNLFCHQSRQQPCVFDSNIAAIATDYFNIPYVFKAELVRYQLCFDPRIARAI